MANLARHDLHNREVEINRRELLDRLESNLRKHVVDYREALTGYKEQAHTKLTQEAEKAQKRFNEQIKKVRETIENFDPEKPEDIEFTDHFVLINQAIMTMPVPKCYEEEYKAAIDMVRYDVRETLTLSFAEFNCFFRDEWDWKSDFVKLSKMYVGTKS